MRPLPSALGHLRRRRWRRKGGIYGHFVEAGDLCFDIGANEGNRVAMLRALGSRVVAVEPQPQCVETLRRRFRDDPFVTIVPAGLADVAGTRTLRIANFHTISSMSEEWIDAVRESGRFANYNWSRKIEVPVRTLDQMIEQFGLPRFCKVDVEGFEFAVLKGLSQPIPIISLEFVAEYRVNAERCIARLVSLGDYEFNYSPGETLEFASPRWISDSQLRQLLGQLREAHPWGDVVARLKAWRPAAERSDPRTQ